MITTLTLDGTDMADTAADLAAGTPTVLDGVTITSGRDNPLDQPAAGHMAATVRALDEAAARNFIDRLEPGQTVTVQSTYELDPLADPTPVQIASTAQTGGRVTVYQQILYIWPAGDLQTYLSPANFEYLNQNPTAWDDTNPSRLRGQPILVETAITVAYDCPRPRVYLATTPGPWRQHTALAPVPVVADVPSTDGTTRTITYHGVVPLPDTGHPVIYLDLPARSWRSLDVLTTWDSRQASATWSGANTVTLSPYITAAATGHVMGAAALFHGYLTGWTAERDGSAVMISLDATDLIGYLSHAMIGDRPRDPERVSQRIDWALGLAGIDVDVLTTATRDPVLASLDVDHRSALDVIHDAATSAALSVWPISTAQGAPALLLEDADTRPATDSLTVDEDGTPHITSISHTVLDAALIDAAGVTVSRDSTDAASQALATYLIEHTDPETGEITRETLSVIAGEPGAAVLKLDTQTVSASDAAAAAYAYLRRRPLAGWSISGLVVRTSRLEDMRTIQRLIDMTTRPACPVIVADLPAWIPAPGSERFIVEGAHMTARRGHWDIELTLTRPARAGTSLTWGQTPPQLTWQSSTLTWPQLSGLVISR